MLMTKYFILFLLKNFNIYEKTQILMYKISKYDDFRNSNILFSREHDKFINKYNIDLISFKGIKLPFVGLYQIIFNLFKNNSINLKVSDSIVLCLSAISYLSKENKDITTKLININKSPHGLL